MKLYSVTLEGTPVLSFCTRVEVIAAISQCPERHAVIELNGVNLVGQTNGADWLEQDRANALAFWSARLESQLERRAYLAERLRQVRGMTPSQARAMQRKEGIGSFANPSPGREGGKAGEIRGIKEEMECLDQIDIPLCRRRIAELG